MAKAALTMPLRIERRFGLPLRPLGWVATLAIATSVFLEFRTPPPDFGALLHSSGWIALLYALILIALVAPAAAGRIALTMDKGGISLRLRHDNYFFAWCDIEGFEPTNQGLRLDMKGQTKDQNALNILSSRMGISASQLANLVETGTQRWGGITPAVSGGSYTPGDEARRLTVQATRRLQAILLLGLLSCYLSLMGSVAVGQWSENILATRGVRTTGEVVHTYLGDCGRNHCSRKLEYRFRSQTSASVQTGYQTFRDTDRALAPGQKLPVIYDSSQPSRSQAIIQGRLPRPGWGRLFSIAAFVLLLFALSGGVFWGVFRHAQAGILKRLPPDRPRSKPA